MTRTKSILLHILLITIITMAGLFFSYYDFIRQRVGSVVAFFGIALSFGLLIGTVLGLVRMKHRKTAAAALFVYAVAAVAVTSVLYFQRTYVPACSKQARKLFDATKDVSRIETWCLTASDANYLYSNMELNLNSDAFEALLARGVAHPDPACARLKFAIYDEDVDRVKAMVEQGVDVNCSTTGTRPVDVIAMLENKPGAGPGSQARMHALLGTEAAAVHVTLQDVKKAIMSRDHAQLMKLVKHFNVNTGDTRLVNRFTEKDVTNPLALAIMRADPKSVAILLDAGADTSQRLIHRAIENGKEVTREVTLYQYALGMYTTSKNTRREHVFIEIVNAMSRYHVLTEAEQKKVDQYNEQKRAEEERQFQEADARLSEKYSGLYDAIRNGDLGTVKLYIENKRVDINFAEFEMGYSTPLMAAVSENQVEIVEYLLKKKADVAIATSEGEDALNIACGRGYLPIVKLLVAHGANVNVNYDTEGRGALDLAIGSGNVDLVRFLLSKGADVNAAQERAGSLMYFAVQSRNLAMVKFLADAGLDVNKKHKYGKTPLDLAIENNYQDIAAFLKSKGAKQSKELGSR